jgi:hypothetical protein
MSAENNDEGDFIRRALSSRSPHEILGVAANASEAEITRQYRLLMRRFHPDKRGDENALFTEVTARITSAMSAIRKGGNGASNSAAANQSDDNDDNDAAEHQGRGGNDVDDESDSDDESNSYDINSMQLPRGDRMLPSDMLQELISSLKATWNNHDAVRLAYAVPPSWFDACAAQICNGLRAQLGGVRFGCSVPECKHVADTWWNARLHLINGHEPFDIVRRTLVAAGLKNDWREQVAHVPSVLATARLFAQSPRTVARECQEKLDNIANATARLKALWLTTGSPTDAKVATVGFGQLVAISPHSNLPNDGPHVLVDAAPAATWANAAQCAKCDAPFRTRFWMAQGRHHCRQCGVSLCDACCVRGSLPHCGFGANELVRACAQCAAAGRVAAGEAWCRWAASRGVSPEQSCVALSIGLELGAAMPVSSNFLAVCTAVRDALMLGHAKEFEEVWRRVGIPLDERLAATACAVAGSDAAMANARSWLAAPGALAASDDASPSAAAQRKSDPEQSLALMALAWALGDRDSARAIAESVAAQSGEAQRSFGAWAAALGATNGATTESLVYGALAADNAVACARALVDGGHTLVAVQVALAALSGANGSSAATLLDVCSEALEPTDPLAALGAKKAAIAQHSTAQRARELATLEASAAAASASLTNRLRLAVLQRDVPSLLTELLALLEGRSVGDEAAIAALAQVAGGPQRDEQLWTRMAPDAAMHLLVHGCALMLRAASRGDSRHLAADGVAAWCAAVQVLPMPTLAEFVGDVLGDPIWHNAALAALSAAPQGPLALVLAGRFHDVDAALGAGANDAAMQSLTKFAKGSKQLKSLRRFERAVRAELQCKLDAAQTRGDAAAALESAACLLFNASELELGTPWLLARVVQLLLDAAAVADGGVATQTSWVRVPVVAVSSPLHDAAHRFALVRAALALASDLADAAQRRPQASRTPLVSFALWAVRRGALLQERISAQMVLIDDGGGDEVRGDSEHKPSPFIEHDMTVFAKVGARAARSITAVPVVAALPVLVSEAPLVAMLLVESVTPALSTHVLMGRNEHLQALRGNEALRTAVPSLSQVALARYDGAFCGWDDEADAWDSEACARAESQREADSPLETMRVRCRRTAVIGALLDERGFTPQHLGRVAAVPFESRDSDGFMPPRATPLLLAADSLSVVTAVEFDTSNGDLSLRGNKTGRGSGGLVDGADLAAVAACRGVSAVLFSLDPLQVDAVDSTMPCQHLVCAPGVLWNTARRLLDTLVITDYLLKMLTTGVEVSAIAPFVQRDADVALLQRLPFGVRSQLIALVAEANSSRNASQQKRRFWIENDVVPVDISGPGEGDNCVIVSVGSVKMRVCTRALEMNAEGRLVDAAVPDDASDPHARLAAFLTDNYNALATAFPCFGRLRELAKVIAAVRCIRVAIADAMFKRELPPAVAALDRVMRGRAAATDNSDMDRALSQLAEAIRSFPSATSERVAASVGPARPSESLLPSKWQIRADLKAQNSHVTYWTSALESQLDSAVDSNWRQLHSQLADLQREWDNAYERNMTVARANDNAVRQSVVALLRSPPLLFDVQRAEKFAGDWLRSGRMPDLISAAAQRNSTISSAGRLQVTCHSDAVDDDLRAELSVPREAWGSSSAAAARQCDMIVAVAAHQDDSRRVSGGVQLSANIRQQALQPPAHSAHRMGPTVLNNERVLAAPNSNAQRIDNDNAARQAAYNRAVAVAARAGNELVHVARSRAMKDLYEDKTKFNQLPRHVRTHLENQINSGTAPSRLKLPSDWNLCHSASAPRRVIGKTNYYGVTAAPRYWNNQQSAWERRAGFNHFR